MQKITVLFLLSIIFFTACGNKDADVIRPTITIEKIETGTVDYNVCGQWEQGVLEVKGGEQLKLTVLFEDDQQLSQYKIDIHQNFDCHGHGSGTFPNISLPDVDGATTDWTVLEIRELSGISQLVDINLSVPENVTAGNYHFTLQVLDLSGNEAENITIFTVRVLNPRDTTEPQLIVHQPVTGSLEITRGEVLIFSGTVTDDQPLENGGNGVVFLSYSSSSGSNSFSTDAYRIFEEGAGNSADFELSYQVPAFLTAGNYKFYLIATDGVRNVSETKVYEVVVK